MILWMAGLAFAGPCDDLAWSRFRWLGEREAMSVRVKVDGRKAWFQLDTGANGSIVYGGGPLRDVGRADTAPNGKPVRRVEQLEVGSHASKPGVLYRYDDMAGSRKLAGTIGADVFDGAVLVVDYPGRRFAVATDAAARKVRAAAELGPAENLDDRLFVPVSVGSSVVNGIFFDTGSSAFDLVVDRADWQALSGRTEPAADAPIVEGYQWGKPDRWIGAKVEQLGVGAVSVDEATVWFQEGRPDAFAGFPNGARGIIGNRPFFDHVVVLDFEGNGEHSGGFGLLSCEDR